MGEYILGLVTGILFVFFVLAMVKANDDDKWRRK